MKTEIIVAIIGGVCLVLSTIIPALINKSKHAKEQNGNNNVKINQKQSGKKSTQIGIQNNYTYGDKGNE